MRPCARTNSSLAQIERAIFGALLRGNSVLLLSLQQPVWLTDTNMRQGMEYAEDVAQPPQYADDHDGVQDRFDGICHGDELINQPQNYPDDDQSEQYLN
jgi:hypothetical protein